jgi:hypothetical protein
LRDSAICRKPYHSIGGPRRSAPSDRSISTIVSTLTEIQIGRSPVFVDQNSLSETFSLDHQHTDCCSPCRWSKNSSTEFLEASVLMKPFDRHFRTGYGGVTGRFGIRTASMLRLEVVLYLLSSLVLAWTGGWFFVNGFALSLVLDCAAWSALTVWILVRSVRSGFRAGSAGTGETELP